MRAVLLAIAMLALSTAILAEDAPPRSGIACPQFSLYDAANQRVRLQDIREPVIVLNFWAFWCDTWIAELPQLRELAGQQAEMHFKLLAVSVDGRWREQLQAVCGEAPLPFGVLMDSGSELSRALGVRRVPTVIVLDRRRKVVSVHEAYPGNVKVLEAVRNAANRQ